MKIKVGGNFSSTRLTKAAARVRSLESLELRRLMAVATGPFGLTDSQFGTSGHVITAGLNVAAAQQLIVGPDNQFYAGSGSGIVRVTAAGKVDTTFGDDGLAALTGGSFIAEAVDASGRVYALVQDGSNTELTRFTPTGTVDATYGTSGTAVVLSDANFTPAALAIGRNEKPVIAGTESLNDATDKQMRVVRASTDGSLDASFASGGSFSATLGQPSSSKPDFLDGVAGVAVLGDGNIVIGGGSYTLDANDSRTVPQFVVVDLTSTGELSSDFASRGFARQTYATTDATVFLPTAFAISSSGQTYLAMADQNPELIVASFNSVGRALYDRQITVDPSASYTLEGLSVLPDGRAVLFSRAAVQSTGFAMTPLNKKGLPGGTVLTDDLDPTTTDIVGGTGAIATAPGGQIVVAGLAGDGSGMELQQFLPGTISDPASGTFADGGDNSIAYGPDGQIHVAYYNTSARDLMYVSRLRNGLWTTPIVLDPRPGAGTFVSIAVDGNSNPSVAYYDSRSKTLKFATSLDKGKHFSVSLIDASADVGQFASLFVDPSTARPSIAYYDKTHGDLKFAALNAKKIWKISVIDSKGDVGRWATLHATIAGRLGIAYVDSTSGYVKFADTDKNGNFNMQNAARAVKGAESLCWTSDQFNSPAIYYHDLGSGEVRESDYSVAAGGFSAETVAESGGQELASIQLGYDEDYPNFPVLFLYNKSAKRVTTIGGPSVDATQDTVITGGGQYLNAVSAGEGVIASYIDTDGNLVVEPVPELY